MRSSTWLHIASGAKFMPEALLEKDKPDVLRILNSFI